MNLKCISLAGVIFLAAVASACGGQDSQDLSGSAVGIEEPAKPAPGDEPAPGGEEPVKPGDPNAPVAPADPNDPSSGGQNAPAPNTGSATDVKDVINSVAPTKRVNYQVLADLCGDNELCLASLERYKAAIVESCTDAEVNVGCPQGILQFNTDIPSSQLRAGRVPVGFPSSSDVAASIEELNQGGSEPAGEEPAQGEEPVSGEEPVKGEEEPVAVAPEGFDELIKELETWAGTHDRVAADLITGCNDADCKAALTKVIEVIEDGCQAEGIVCPADADGFLEKPTAEEVASGELGESFPLTEDLINMVKSLKTAPVAP